MKFLPIICGLHRFLKMIDAPSFFIPSKEQ
jgi:hypothetical protein